MEINQNPTIMRMKILKLRKIWEGLKKLNWMMSNYGKKKIIKTD